MSATTTDEFIQAAKEVLIALSNREFGGSSFQSTTLVIASNDHSTQNRYGDAVPTPYIQIENNQ